MTNSTTPRPAGLRWPADFPNKHERPTLESMAREARLEQDPELRDDVLVCAVCAGTVEGGKCDTCGRIRPPTHVEVPRG